MAMFVLHGEVGGRFLHCSSHCISYLGIKTVRMGCSLGCSRWKDRQEAMPPWSMVNGQWPSGVADDKTRRHPSHKAFRTFTVYLNYRHSDTLILTVRLFSSRGHLLVSTDCSSLSGSGTVGKGRRGHFLLVCFRFLLE